MQGNIGVTPAYLAHLTQDGREQTVAEHLSGTADRCAVFSASFAAEEQGRLAGLAHDLGKYSDAFQRRLQGSTERVDHATAGAAECCKQGQIYAAFVVAGHHGTDFAPTRGRGITRMSPPFAAA